MALYQELTNQGRVVGGHLTNGTVLSGGLGAKGDLLVQLGFKRQKLNTDTVREWEDITTMGAAGGVASAIGQAAAGAILPGFVGKAAGAAVGAAMRSGHTVHVDWVDGKQSIIQLPEKLFMVLSVLLKTQQRFAEAPRTPAAGTPAPRSTSGRDRAARQACLTSRSGNSDRRRVRDEENRIAQAPLRRGSGATQAGSL